MDHAPSGPLRILHPLLADLDAGTPAPFDASAVRSAARVRDAAAAAHALMTGSSVVTPWMDVRGSDSADVGSPQPAAHADLDASPLRAAAVRTASYIGAAVASPTRLVHGILREMMGVVTAAIQVVLPQATTSALTRLAAVPAPAIAEAVMPSPPQHPALQLIFEPRDDLPPREQRRVAEAEGRRHADGMGVPQAVNLLVPEFGDTVAVSIANRFSLVHGIYISPEGQRYPPLWLHWHGNPGGVWSELRGFVEEAYVPC